MTRTQKYWTCQFSGWGFYALTWFLFGLNPAHPLSFRISYTVTLFLLQLGFTHFYRYTIRRFKWLELPIRKNILRVIFSSIFLAIIIESLLLLSFNFYHLSELKDLSFRTYVVLYVNRAFVNFAWSVIYFAVHYFESSNDAKIENLRYEMMLKEFELQVLKSQMNPHFIFNAINSISGLINENPQKAQFALSQLSSLLRYSLNVNKNETVPLEEEMHIVTDYLELESIRFEERLKIKMDISADSLRAYIPPLIVQTLCENSIKHGISKLQDGGELSIRSSVDKKHLRIEITNSGKVVDNGDKDEASGYGVRNTRQRLALLYGDNASFDLRNISDKTVLAEVVIPL
ncbi:MAG: sensor histidine kinase [Methanococcaceae archaeon]